MSDFIITIENAETGAVLHINRSKMTKSFFTPNDRLVKDHNGRIMREVDYVSVPSDPPPVKFRGASLKVYFGLTDKVELYAHHAEAVNELLTGLGITVTPIEP